MLITIVTLGRTVRMYDLQSEISIKFADIYHNKEKTKKSQVNDNPLTPQRENIKTLVLQEDDTDNIDGKIQVDDDQGDQDDNIHDNGKDDITSISSAFTSESVDANIAYLSSIPAIRQITTDTRNGSRPNNELLSFLLGDDTNNDQNRMVNSRTTNYESTQQCFVGMHTNTNVNTNENDVSNNQRVYQSKKSSLRVRL